jgi:hypothetical protein
MRENKLLNELVKDCITYKLTETEAIKYIELRYGKNISVRSYKRRKALIKSDTSTQLWLNHFTRVGFVKSHIEHLETINKIRNELMHQFSIEINKPNRDEDKILKIIDRIMEATKLLVGLDMGSPIIAEIKAKLEQKVPAEAAHNEQLLKQRKKRKKVQQ